METQAKYTLLRAFVADSGEPGLQATFKVQPCGCKIVGNGTLPHPLDIEYCPKHAAATELLEVCKAVDWWMTFDVPCPGAQLRAAIIKATR